MKNYMLIFLIGLVFTSSIFGQKEEFEYGMASYYSDKYQGSPTASGEEYDKAKMTAAHKTLPFGTMIKVTRLDNKKSVRVRVNDRGPYIKDRVVDISKAAAEKLDMIREGQTKVKVEIVSGPASSPSVASKPKKETTTPKSFSEETAAITKPKEAKPKKETTKKSTTKAAPSKKSKVAATSPKKVAEKSVAASSKMTLVKGKDFQPYDLYKIELLRPEKKGFGVQVASFSHYESVFKQIAELQGEWFKNIMLSVEKGNEGTPVYKIILGPFDDEKTAQAYKKNLKKKKISGFVVNLETIAY